MRRKKRLMVKIMCAGLLCVTFVNPLEVKANPFNRLEFVTQQNELEGTVKDQAGLPLSGVTVKIPAENRSAITDEQGKFRLIISKDNYTLEFSMQGYEKKTLNLKKGESVHVVLNSTQEVIDEVVVVGYGTQKARSISSSISKIKSESLNDRPATRIDNAIAGKLAGVQVQEISGQPGKGLTVKVRGSNSINYSSNPLYVVDGFPLTGGLDNINPNDIESIEVLKDAASAAIYGSRGANGVVLVTTKSGKSGEPTLAFDTYFGIQKRLSKYDLLNRDEYIEFAIEERNNTWMLQGGNANDPNDKRSNAAFWIDPAWSNPSALPDNDWQKLIEQKAPLMNYQLSALGGNESWKYYFSGNYMNQKGIIIGSNYERYSFLTNIESGMKKHFSFGLNLATSATIKNDGDSDGDGGPVSRSQYMLPLMDIDSQTEEYGYNPFYAAFIVNPFALASELINETNIKNIRATPYVNIRFMENLKLKSSLGMEYTTSINQFFKPNNINRGAGASGSTSTFNDTNILTEHILAYDKEWQKSNLAVMGGFTYQKGKVFQSSFAKAGFPDDDIYTLNAGSLLNSGSSDLSEWALMSFLSRLNYGYQDKYFLSASVRRDGSSRFGSENKWGWFPALSAAWVISEESFFENKALLNNLKLRASYGLTGNNNISNYASIARLSNANYPLGKGGAQSIQNGYIPNSFSNRSLGWEKTYTLDFGIDVSLLRNRISMVLDYYKSDTKDLLLNVPIPAEVGFSTSLMNIGQVRNTGVELEINTVNLNKAFKWNTSFNISHNKNEVIKLGPTGAPIYGSAVINNITVTQIGNPIGSYYLFVQDGVFKNAAELAASPHYKKQQVGDIRYKDVNQDGEITEDDKQIVGHNTPKFFWGVQNNFSYRNFDLYLSLDGQWGNKLLTVSGSSDGQSRANDEGYWRDRWRSEENPGNGIVPRAVVSPNMTTPSTFWLRNASFFRIRTIGFGYNFEGQLIQKLKGVKSLRMALNADNVFMHDHNNGSPQTANKSNSNLVPGIDYGASYPLARTFTFNVNLKF